MIDSISKRSFLLIAAASLALAGCPTETNAPADMPSGAGGEYTVEGDYIQGDANAPVTLVEYASVACGGCAFWHQTVYPDIKKKYIDTGKVKYVFRPFPAANPEMATAGHKLAYCAPREQFFDNIKLQFDRQQQIMGMMQKGQGRQAYFSLAKASGLSEEEFLTCLSNPEIQARYDRDTQLGTDMGVTGTPTMFVNGQRTGSSLDALEEAILPIVGEPVPEKSAE